jgi:hypothetical protein
VDVGAGTKIAMIILLAATVRKYAKIDLGKQDEELYLVKCNLPKPTTLIAEGDLVVKQKVEDRLL